MDDEETAGYLDLVKWLKSEYDKPKPDKSRIKTLMKQTFGGRRQWILDDEEDLRVESILEIFPSLKNNRFVSLLCTWLMF